MSSDLHTAGEVKGLNGLIETNPEPHKGFENNAGTNKSPHFVLNRIEQIAIGAETKSKHSWRIIAQTISGVLLVINTGVIVYTALHNLPAPGAKAKLSADSNQAVTVTAAPVEERTIADVLPITGTVGAWDELKVGSELSGLHVKAIYAEEGDFVQKGQLLAELNSGLLEAQLIQAEAKLKSAEANLAKSIQPNRNEEIAKLKAAFEQAKSNALEVNAQRDQDRIKLESAELNVPRFESLASVGAVSKVEAETKRFDRDTAKLELQKSTHKVVAAEFTKEQSKQQLLLAMNGGRSEDIAITRASIEEARGQIKLLKEEIQQTKILAPDHGRILQRNIHIGDTSSAATPFFIMSRNSRLELAAQVNSNDLPKIHEGQEVSIIASSNEKIKGHVRLVSPQVDPITRLGKVRIDFPESSLLKSGMFVSAEVILKQKTGLSVPVNCVISSDGKSHVFLLDGKHASRRSVETGLQNSKYVQIDSGLQKGQLVIVKGARFLSNGDAVRLSESSEPEL